MVDPPPPGRRRIPHLRAPGSDGARIRMWMSHGSALTQKARYRSHCTASATRPVSRAMKGKPVRRSSARDDQGRPGRPRAGR
ncbi:hypothetical protein DIZ27_20300 [Streptomyces sp. NWU339]|nr:hypothetical protein DIZ27_20300 [Streptomyces sp. NWU339]